MEEIVEKIAEIMHEIESIDCLSYITKKENQRKINKAYDKSFELKKYCQEKNIWGEKWNGR